MKLIDQARNKLVRMVARYGLTGTLLHIATWPGRALQNLSPGRRRGLAFAADQSARFDREFGVDTDGQLDINTLTVTGENRTHGEFYLGSDPDVLREALAALPIVHDKFAFVDYGSGKGRALLIASEFPFKFIIGVEFAAELHHVCEENLKAYRNSARRCIDIRPIHQDVATFDPPEEPLVLYFYNPFDRVIFDAVINRLHNSLRRQPRAVWIIYTNPKDRKRFDESPFLKAVAANSLYCIYRSIDLFTDLGPPLL
jgi:hypothetical protein